MQEPDRPEHRKLDAVKHFSQKIGSFLEWLEQKGIELCERHKHQDYCYGHDERDGEHMVGDHDYLECEVAVDALIPWNKKISTILAEFFGIDEKKLEDEKQAMLEFLAEENRHG